MSHKPTLGNLSVQGDHKKTAAKPKSKVSASRRLSLRARSWVSRPTSPQLSQRRVCSQLKRVPVKSKVRSKSRYKNRSCRSLLDSSTPQRALQDKSHAHTRSYSAGRAVGGPVSYPRTQGTTDLVDSGRPSVPPVPQSPEVSKSTKTALKSRLIKTEVNCRRSSPSVAWEMLQNSSGRSGDT